jgi:hypothetical protein
MAQDHTPMPAEPVSGAIAQSRSLDPQTKRAAVLRVFLERGERGLNCFEAVRLAHDYILRTTVSECSRLHRIDFAKRFEAVPGHAGSKVDCVRYSLTADGAARVRELLGESLEAA